METAPPVAWEPATATPAAPPTRQIAWSGVAAAVVFVVAAIGVLGTWVSGVAPEADGAVGGVLDLAGFDPGETVTYRGLDVPGVGATAAVLALCGAALAVAGVALRRPVLLLSTSGIAGAVAALAGLAVALLAWLEIDNIPLSSNIPSDVRAQIPDPDVGVGLWVYLAGASIGAVLCAAAAVTSYRHRYGIRRHEPALEPAPAVDGWPSPADAHP